MGKAVPPLLGPGLYARKIQVRAKDVVLVRAHLEASEGLASLFAQKGGALTLASPVSQRAALDDFIASLERELSLCVSEPGYLVTESSL